MPIVYENASWSKDIWKFFNGLLIQLETLNLIFQAII